MKKLLYPFINLSLFLSLLFVAGCEEGNPVTNNYYEYQGDTTIVIDTTIVFDTTIITVDTNFIDTTIIVDTTIIIGDTNSNTWGFDPLISGTDLDTYTFQSWHLEDIDDGQNHVCGSNLGTDNTNCMDYYEEFLCSISDSDPYGPRFSFVEDGYIFMNNCNPVQDENSRPLITWKTRDGILKIEISDTSLTTPTFEYFFNGKEYNYSVDINSQNLIIRNDVSILRFSIP